MKVSFLLSDLGYLKLGILNSEFQYFNFSKKPRNPRFWNHKNGNGISYEANYDLYASQMSMSCLYFRLCNKKKSVILITSNVDRLFGHFLMRYITTNDIFWKTERKLHKISMFSKNEVQNLNFFTPPWHKCRNECYHWIVCPAWPVRHVFQDTRTILSYCDLIWPILGLCVVA